MHVASDQMRRRPVPPVAIDRVRSPNKHSPMATPDMSPRESEGDSQVSTPKVFPVQEPIVAGYRRSETLISDSKTAQDRLDIASWSPDEKAPHPRALCSMITNADLLEAWSPDEKAPHPRDRCSMVTNVDTVDMIKTRMSSEGTCQPKSSKGLVDKTSAVMESKGTCLPPQQRPPQETSTFWHDNLARYDAQYKQKAKSGSNTSTKNQPKDKMSNLEKRIARRQRETSIDWR